MQITGGAYGAVSGRATSDGRTHACADKKLDVEIFREVVSWVIRHDVEIRKLLFPALVKQYWEMRDLVVASLVNEAPNEVVPAIETPEQLAPLCGLVALHIGGISHDGQPRFGIELGCNWEPEHGAGVRFVGLKVVQAGAASEAFTFRTSDTLVAPMPTDAHQVQPAKPSVSSPKGKTLADRLKQLITSFPEGHFASIKDAMHCGFELSCSLDNWNERNEQFLVERIHKYIAEDPGLQGMVEADFQRKLLYGFLWGYVFGPTRVSALHESRVCKCEKNGERDDELLQVRMSIARAFTNVKLSDGPSIEVST